MTWPWISLDLATKSGFAVWLGDEVKLIGTIRPKGTNGKWCIEYGHPVGRGPIPDMDMVFDIAAPGAPLAVVQPWRFVFDNFPARPRLVVVERPYGKFRKADASLAERRGLVRAVAAERGARLEELNTGTWRRAAKETWGCTWDNGDDGDNERVKSLARSLVAEHYKWTARSDEADAVLVGHAALRMRIVDLTSDGWGVSAPAPKPPKEKKPRKAKASVSPQPTLIGGFDAAPEF